ncbi:hypothetical protein [Nostoc sp.]
MKRANTALVRADGREQSPGAEFQVILPIARTKHKTGSSEFSTP